MATKPKPPEESRPRKKISKFIAWLAKQYSEHPIGVELIRLARLFKPSTGEVFQDFVLRRSEMNDKALLYGLIAFLRERNEWLKQDAQAQAQAKAQARDHEQAQMRLHPGLGGGA